MKFLLTYPASKNTPLPWKIPGYAPAQVFPCELCEFCKNTAFYRTPQVAASKTNNIQNTYADDILYSQVPNDRNVEIVINSDYHSFQFIMTTSSYHEPICVFLWKKHHPTLLLTSLPPPLPPHHFMEVINISKQHNIFK